jgi:hypothetical protein
LAGVKIGISFFVDPMLCPKCGGTMKVVAFLTEHAIVDGIIEHLKLRFIAEKPPPSRIPDHVTLLTPLKGVRSSAKLARVYRVSFEKSSYFQ